jgi:hypothetical protein
MVEELVIYGIIEFYMKVSHIILIKIQLIKKNLNGQINFSSIHCSP